MKPMSKGASQSGLSRRAALKMFGAAASLAFVPRMAGLALPPQQRADYPTGPEHVAMRNLALAFMNQFYVPALSVAMVRDGGFVYEGAFGKSDAEHQQQCTDATVFRIASVSKPITSVAIFTLVEQNKVHLSDKVFGPSGILGNDYSKGPYKQYVTDVTVDHLLTHTSGGWSDDSTDPMFRDKGWDFTKLISWTLENLPLTSPPGERFVYSNFGYCVLGRVIEKITGQSYANYVQQAVLGPCGITDMQIGGDSSKHPAPNEAVYFGQFNEKPYDINVPRLDSTAGWIASPSDLCRFAFHLGGGSAAAPSILKPETIRVMTTPSPAYPQSSPARYARGWMVGDNGAGNWWHNGSLPGSTSILVRLPNGMCWAALINTRTQPSATIDNALDQLVWNMAGQVRAWNM